MTRAMFIKGLLTILLMAALVIVTGCGEKENPESKAKEDVSMEDVKQETKEAYEATKAYTQEQVQAFRQATETKLGEYDKKMDQLQESTEKLGADAKIKAEQQLAALRQKRNTVSEKMKEMGTSDGCAWDQFKADIDAAMEDLDSAYNNAVAEFSKP
jgi:hypothetical protein